MNSFDYGRVFGQLFMLFALFVVIAFALNKIPGLSHRPWIAHLTAFGICSLLILSSQAPLEVCVIALILLSPLAFWRYRAVSKK